jgi:antitoxin (DNA-binding transcriptional repressor) of toxin-antitoxin stability system
VSPPRKSSLSCVAEAFRVAKAGRPIARLVPFAKPGQRSLGQDEGRVFIADDFDAPLTDDLLADFER